MSHELLPMIRNLGDSGLNDPRVSEYFFLKTRKNNKIQNGQMLIAKRAKMRKIEKAIF